MKFGVQLYSLRERAEKEGAEKVLSMVAEAVAADDSNNINRLITKWIQICVR